MPTVDQETVQELCSSCGEPEEEENGCLDCCTCGPCGHCSDCGDSHDGTEEEYFDYCDTCRDYHYSYGCDGCGCGVCGYLCEECGDCGYSEDESDPVGRLYGDTVQATYLRLQRKVGVELECEEGDYSAARDRVGSTSWGFKSDGSLASFPIGLETVSPPGYGDTFEHELRNVFVGLARAGYEATENAGIHVHVDLDGIRGTKEWELFAVTAAAQDALYSLQPDRRDSQWCAPLKEHRRREDGHVYADDYGAGLATAETVLSYLKQSRGKARTQLASQVANSRYSLVCIGTRHGTAEWRMFGSTMNPDTALAWAALCQHIVEYAASSFNEKEVLALSREPNVRMKLRMLFQLVKLPPKARAVLSKLQASEAKKNN